MKANLSILSLLLLLATPLCAWAIHDSPGDTKCLDCHKTLPFDREKLTYTDEVGQTCRKCHSNFPCQPQNTKDGFSHPLDRVVPPTMSIPRDMPLTESGKLTCITCHSYHAEFWDAEYKNASLLRRSKGMNLCHACHPKFPVK